MTGLTESDKTLLRLLQRELPLCGRPFAELAERAGLTEGEVIRRVRGWLESGIIRRVGAFIVHRRAGFEANGMVVWDVPEERVEETGKKMAMRGSVSHCYARPRSERWPFSLYTMIHGKTRGEVEAEARAIAEELGIERYRILFSARELKKSDTKLFMEDGE
jgi:DNA-binding Lrp family transcriptional regulator